MFACRLVSCAIRCITARLGHYARYIADDEIRLFRNNNQTATSNNLIVDLCRPGRQTGFVFVCGTDHDDQHYRNAVAVLAARKVVDKPSS
jgi:hypothetical protein